LNNDLISIITVCYNSEKTISRTFESVINQDFPNYEYIVIDGGSSDKTLSIIKDYKDKFKKKGIDFRYISEKDEGIYDAMNKGIKMANGDLIGFLNSDDWYEKEALKKVYKVYKEKTSSDIFHGEILYVYEIGNELYYVFEKTPDISLIKKAMIVNFPATFVRKEVFNKIGFFSTEYKIASDYDFILRAYLKNFKFEYIPEIITCFSLGGTSSDTITSFKEANKIKQKYNLELSKNTILYKRVFNKFIKKIYFYFIPKKIRDQIKKKRFNEKMKNKIVKVEMNRR